MVDLDNDIIISSEESQTVFEGEQASIQPPPVNLEQNLKQKKNRRILGLVLGLLAILAVTKIYIFGSDRLAPSPAKQSPTPTPAPIYTDQAMEDELKRVEGIVSATNPEILLLPPPQVNMLVDF